MVRVQYVNLVRDRVEKLQEGYEGESWRFRQHKSHLSLFFSYVCFSFLDHESAPIIIRSSQKYLMSVRNAFWNLALGGTKFFRNYIAQIKLNEPWYKREPHSSESSV